MGACMHNTVKFAAREGSRRRGMMTARQHSQCCARLSSSSSARAVPWQHMQCHDSTCSAMVTRARPLAQVQGAPSGVYMHPATAAVAALDRKKICFVYG